MKYHDYEERIERQERVLPLLNQHDKEQGHETTTGRNEAQDRYRYIS